MSLWNSAEAQSATLGNASSQFSVDGLSIDTRTLKAGDLFVARVILGCVACSPL